MDREKVMENPSTEHWMEKGTIIEFDYVNWEGKALRRKAIVGHITYGANQYHPEKQFLLHALDLSKGEWRGFAMNDISNLIVIGEF